MGNVCVLMNVYLSLNVDRIYETNECNSDLCVCGAMDQVLVNGIVELCSIDLAFTR
jgi:hypothetical protein